MRAFRFFLRNDVFTKKSLRDYVTNQLPFCGDHIDLFVILIQRYLGDK
jgi:hypothetical protein